MRESDLKKRVISVNFEKELKMPGWIYSKDQPKAVRMTGISSSGVEKVVGDRFT